MEKFFLTPEELSERWIVTVEGLTKWRNTGKGPKWVKLNSIIRYRLEDVLAYEQENENIKATNRGGWDKRKGGVV
jgi:hypothetical protein